MDAEDPLVVQIIGQLANWLVESVELGPIDRVEENRASEALPQFGAFRGGDMNAFATEVDASPA